MNARELDQFLLSRTEKEEMYYQNILNHREKLNENQKKLSSSSIVYDTDTNMVTISSGDFLIVRQQRFVQTQFHCHDFIEMNYVYKGTCIQMINNQEKILLKQGQLFILNPNAVSYTHLDVYKRQIW